MPITTDLSYTAASSEETVQLKLKYGLQQENQSHSTKTYERKPPWNHRGIEQIT